VCDADADDGDYGVIVKYFSPMTNVCIIRVAREQHKVAWGAVTLLSMVDRQRVVPNVVHVSGASLPAASPRVCAHDEL
jgi:RNase P/RNase MRP subunit POP5